MAVPLFNKDINYLLFFLLPFIVFIVAIWRYRSFKEDSDYSTIFLLLQFLYLYLFIIISYSIYISMFNLIYSYNKYVNKGNKKNIFDYLAMIFIVITMIIIIIFTILLVTFSSFMLGYFNID
jgi:hypothetical protein